MPATVHRSLVLSLSFVLLLLSLWLPLARAQAPSPPTVLIYGDSLSAGYGIALEQSWPSLLQKRLASAQRPYRLVNASISGETTAGGRARLEAALNESKPAVMVLALGANDGLRGLPVAQMRDNLSAMLRLARERKVRVLLVGMRLPPNYGPAYNQAFEASFAQLAKAEKAALLPFLLEPIAADANAFQPDQLHPVAAAQPRLLEHVWSALKPLLK
ncbi:MAG: arylesterase [Rhodocyclaceae bacterium]|nr:arylesterase [Rhodocyclaceae bacterium]